MSEALARGKERVSFWFSALRARLGTVRMPAVSAKGIALGALVLAGLLAVNHVVLAQDANDIFIQGSSKFVGPFIPETETGILNKIGQILGILLYAFIYILIQIDILLTNLLIGVAQYNGFSTSVAVTTGWPIIRDVCNMFFIIVLLLIAFSTIIGYDKFHYKKWLPKLLLTAVLINFSKTLIGLLIDLSQVIMLTFVAGFKEAAFGNFARAFQTTEILNLGGNIPGIWNIVAAEVFGLFILTVASTTLIILLIYFVTRIVGLWILIILSPLAFLTSALPDSISSKLGPVSKDFWGKLGGWLTGGPIAAFFLWLSLAVIQQGAANGADGSGPFGDVLGLNANNPELQGLSSFITRVANYSNFGNFIVSVAFMLMGIQAAMEGASKAGGITADLAKWAKKDGGLVFRTGRAAAGVAGRGASRAANAVDARLGITRNLSTQIGKQSAAWAQAGQRSGNVVGRLGYGLASIAAGGAAGGVGSYYKTRMAENEKSLAEKTKGKSPQEQLRILMAQNAVAMNDEQRVAAQQQMHKLTATGAGQKAMKQVLKDTEFANVADDDMKNALANERMTEMLQQQRKSASDLAKEFKIDALSDEIKEEDKKNPTREDDLYKRYQLIDGMEDPAKDMKPAGLQNFSTFMALAKANDWLDADDRLKTGIEADKEFKRYAGNNEMGKYVRTHVANLKTDAGHTRGRAILAAMTNITDPVQKAAAQAAAQAADYSLGLTEKKKDMGRLDRTAPGTPVPGLIADANHDRNYWVTPIGDLSGQGRPVENVNDALRNIPAGAQRTTIEGLMDDAAAKRLRGPLNQAQAAAITATPFAQAVFQNGGPSGASIEQQSEYVRLQSLGISGGALGMYNERGHMQDATRARFEGSIGGALVTAFNGLQQTASAAERAQATGYLSNIESEAIKAGDDVARVVVQAFDTELSAPGRVRGDTGLDRLERAFKTATDAEAARLTQILREMNELAERAKAKAVGDRSAMDIQAINVVDQLLSKDKFRKMIRNTGGKK